jgi:hypothetical protein
VVACGTELYLGTYRIAGLNAAGAVFSGIAFKFSPITALRDSIKEMSGQVELLFAAVHGLDQTTEKLQETEKGFTSLSKKIETIIKKLTLESRSLEESMAIMGDTRNQMAKLEKDISYLMDINEELVKTLIYFKGNNDSTERISTLVTSIEMNVKNLNLEVKRVKIQREESVDLEEDEVEAPHPTTGKLKFPRPSLNPQKSIRHAVPVVVPQVPLTTEKAKTSTLLLIVELTEALRSSNHASDELTRLNDLYKETVKQLNETTLRNKSYGEQINEMRQHLLEFSRINQGLVNELNRLNPKEVTKTAAVLQEIIGKKADTIT